MDQSLEQAKETVGHMMAANHFNTLPIVDGQPRLIGIVTHDDVLDLLRKEGTEEIQTVSGAVIVCPIAFFGAHHSW
jgi:magnesium transporter